MFLFARLLSLVCLIALVALPKDMFNGLKMPEVQVVVATIVVTILVMFDVYTGLILGIGLIVVYYRLYNEEVTVENLLDNDVRSKGPMACLMGKYITNEHLKSAQNNVVNDSELSTQIIGIPGRNSEQVFGAQGMYKQLSGFDQDKAFADAQFK